MQIWIERQEILNSSLVQIQLSSIPHQSRYNFLLFINAKYRNSRVQMLRSRLGLLSKVLSVGDGGWDVSCCNV